VSLDRFWATKGVARLRSPRGVEEPTAEGQATLANGQRAGRGRNTPGPAGGPLWWSTVAVTSMVAG